MPTLLLSLALLAPLSAPIGEPGPGEVVARLEAALAAAAAEELPARLARLRTAVAETHALDELLPGDAGSAADEAERRALAEAAGDLAAAILAVDLEGASGPPLRSGEPELAGERATVRSALPGAELELAFGLRRVAAGWRVVDLAVEGGLGYELIRSAAGAAGQGAGPAELVAELRARAARLLEPPEDVVRRLQAALIDAMRRADELGYAGRRALLAPVVADTHDFESIAKLVLGRAFRSLDAEQQAALVTAFRELAVTSYAARFDAFAGQRFGAPAARELQRGAVMVASAFRKADGGEVDFEYLMRRRDGRWSILNIVVDGVSDLALKKTEYGALIEEGGAAAVLARLEAEIARQAAGAKD